MLDPITSPTTGYGANTPACPCLKERCDTLSKNLDPSNSTKIAYWGKFAVFVLMLFLIINSINRVTEPSEETG